jgi:hypothetical protein
VRGPGSAGTGLLGDLRHTFISLLSDDGMAIEKIVRLAGHASSHVTETVYGQELRAVLQEGAEVMDRLFGSVNSGPAEQRPRTDRTARCPDPEVLPSSPSCRSVTAR